MTFHVKDTFLMSIFKESVLKLARTKGINANKSIDGIERFSMDPTYLDNMRGYCKKPFLITRDDINKKKGLYFMTYNVVSAEYIKKGKEWDVEIILRGVYTQNE